MKSAYYISILLALRKTILGHNIFVIYSCFFCQQGEVVGVSLARAMARFGPGLAPPMH